MMESSRGVRSCWLTLLCACLIACGDQPIEVGLPPDSATIDPPDYAFVGVNVVPMTSETVLSAQTVLIEGRVIQTIGPTGSVEVPDGTTIIDGAGAYLIPGLADMHAHISHENDVIAYAAAGVTSVLNQGIIGGAPDPTTLRTRVLDGSLLGPAIYAGGYVFGAADGFDAARTVATDSAIDARVRLLDAAGYEFVKVLNGLTPSLYSSLVRVAGGRGMKVIGHAPRSLGANAAVNAGMVMLAHSEEHLFTDFGFLNFINQPDPVALATAASTILDNDAYLVSTLVLEDVIAQLAGLDQDAFDRLAATRGMEFLHWSTRVNLWPFSFSSWWNSNTFGVPYTDVAATERAYIKAMWDAGVQIMAGTDAPIAPGLATGYGLWDELRILTEVGLSPYEALSTATRIPGAFISKYAKPRVWAPRFGRVEEGWRADLLLLDANPLEDITNVERQRGVMIRGKWHPASEMTIRLDSLAAAGL